MDFQTFTTAALGLLMLYTGQNLIRYVRAMDWNGILGIVLAWGMGFGAAEWMAHARVTSALELIQGAGPIAKLDFGSLLLLGLGLGSGASGFADYLKARDVSQTARKPRLVPTSYPEDTVAA